MKPLYKIAAVFLLAGFCATGSAGHVSVGIGKSAAAKNDQSPRASSYNWNPPSYGPTAGIDAPPREMPAVARDGASDAAGAGTGAGSSPASETTSSIELPVCRTIGATNFLDYGRCFWVPTAAQTCPSYAPFYDAERNRCYAR